MTTKKQSIQYTKRVLLLLLLLALLMLTAYAFASRGFGWFSKNRVVTANGMQVMSQSSGITAKFYYRTDPENEYAELDASAVPFAGLVPSSKVEFKVELENPDPDFAYTVDVLLGADSGCETPLIKGDVGSERYYHFGTQLKMVGATCSDGGQTATCQSDVFLLPNNTGTEISATTQLTPTDVLVVDDLTVPAAQNEAPGKMTVEFAVEFVNFESVCQDDYQDFGTEGVGGTCWRTLRVVYAEKVS